MTYTLFAFIARAGVLAQTQALDPRITVAPLPQGFEITLNNEILKEVIGRQDEFAQALPQLAELKNTQIELAQARENVEDWFPIHLTNALVAFGLSVSRQQPIAYVEAEFFGGVGEQYGVLWDKRQIALLPSTNGLISHEYADDNKDAPINSVLRALGVQLENSFDEFDALRLVDWR